jgi:GNAT superfamily N-acetyltransferase
VKDKSGTKPRDITVFVFAGSQLPDIMVAIRKCSDRGASVTEQDKIEIRPIRLEDDTEPILSIDRAIRAAGHVITYRNLTAEYILSAGRGIPPQESPASYIRSLTGDAAPLLNLSFVAEVNGHVRGFVLGQVARARESATEIGIVQMIGVHPDYQRKGIGGRLVRALSDKYRSQGIKVMRIGVDYRDKSLLGLVEDAGFGVDRLVIYSMVL